MSSGRCIALWVTWVISNLPICAFTLRFCNNLFQCWHMRLCLGNNTLFETIVYNGIRCIIQRRQPIQTKAIHQGHIEKYGTYIFMKIGVQASQIKTSMYEVFWYFCFGQSLPSAIFQSYIRRYIWKFGRFRYTDKKHTTYMASNWYTALQCQGLEAIGI